MSPELHVRSLAKAAANRLLLHALPVTCRIVTLCAVLLVAQSMIPGAARRSIAEPDTLDETAAVDSTFDLAQAPDVGPPLVDAADEPTEATEPADAEPLTDPVLEAARYRAFKPLRPAPSPCRTSLQALVNAAAPGSTLTVPPCIYRETVTIAKPLTLLGGPGVEIRGSDVWTGWVKSGSYWVQGRLPAFPAHGTCQPGTSRCLWPEQVFFDSRPLQPVATRPTTGQFAVDANRNVLLADDPRGHTIEVTTRTSWVVVRADNVSIEHFVMKHAANDAQTGALATDGVSNITVQDNTLSDAHGRALSVNYGSGHHILGNDVHHAGQLGIGSYRSTDLLIQGNRIHDNNTDSFDSEWEAGGLKMATVSRVVLDRNESWNNAGPGLWCDLSCTSVTYSSNRVHDNHDVGIFFEISSEAAIFGNSVWNNGSNMAEGWGCDIFISSSSNVEVHDNTVLATATHGILVVSQNRPSFTSVVNNYVHDNRIIMNGLYNGFIGRTGLGWIQDWAGTLFAASSNNRGANNAFWFSYPEASTERFYWAGAVNTLAGFNATPGGGADRYLSNTERDQALASAGIPPLV